MTRKTSFASLRSIRLAIVGSLLSGAAVLGGCRNDAGTGALAGGLLGAGAGAIIGHQSGHAGEGALIGAGAGALGGYIIGNESDKHRHDEYYHGEYRDRHGRYRRHPRYDY